MLLAASVGIFAASCNFGYSRPDTNEWFEVTIVLVLADAVLFLP
jgi:hypothetical protein